MARIKDIRRIDKNLREKLSNYGIKTTQEILGLGSSHSGRRRIATSTGIYETRINQLVHLVNIMQIDGIGEETSDLFMEAGITSTNKLAKQTPGSLLKRLKKVNDKKKILKNSPSLNEIKKWIKEAKRFPNAITY